MAGHSKWKQIKHKKALTDERKGQLFSKLIREVSVAVRSGGASSDANPRLRAALERARAVGLPKENLERAIERAAGGGEASTLQEFLYEATATRGVMMLIEGITDNRNRTLAELKRILALHGGRLADPGSVAWNFEKVGTIRFTTEANAGKTIEELETAAIEAGAQDIRILDGSGVVETTFSEWEVVRQALERQGVVIQEVGHDYRPRAVIAPDPETQLSVEKLLDALTDQDDVQEVYTNLAEV